MVVVTIKDHEIDEWRKFMLFPPETNYILLTKTKIEINHTKQKRETVYYAFIYDINDMLLDIHYLLFDETKSVASLRSDSVLSDQDGTERYSSVLQMTIPTVRRKGIYSLLRFHTSLYTCDEFVCLNFYNEATGNLGFLLLGNRIRIVDIAPIIDEMRCLESIYHMYLLLRKGKQIYRYTLSLDTADRYPILDLLHPSHLFIELETIEPYPITLYSCISSPETKSEYVLIQQGSSLYASVCEPSEQDDHVFSPYEMPARLSTYVDNVTQHSTYFYYKAKEKLTFYQNHHCFFGFDQKQFILFKTDRDDFSINEMYMNHVLYEKKIQSIHTTHQSVLIGTDDNIHEKKLSSKEYYLFPLHPVTSVLEIKNMYEPYSTSLKELFTQASVAEESSSLSYPLKKLFVSYGSKNIEKVTELSHDIMVYFDEFQFRFSTSFSIQYVLETTHNKKTIKDRQLVPRLYKSHYVFSVCPVTKKGRIPFTDKWIRIQGKVTQNENVVSFLLSPHDYKQIQHMNKRNDQHVYVNEINARFYTIQDLFPNMKYVGFASHKRTTLNRTYFAFVVVLICIFLCWKYILCKRRCL